MAQIHLLITIILYCLSGLGGIGALIYGYYYQTAMNVFYIGIIGPMYALNISSLTQLISSVSYLQYA
jgi:hypothetical protein